MPRVVLVSLFCSRNIFSFPTFSAAECSCNSFWAGEPASISDPCHIHATWDMFTEKLTVSSEAFDFLCQFSQCFAGSPFVDKLTLCFVVNAFDMFWLNNMHVSCCAMRKTIFPSKHDPPFCLFSSFPFPLFRNISLPWRQLLVKRRIHVRMHTKDTPRSLLFCLSTST